jgi:hypothetical protein
MIYPEFVPFRRKNSSFEKKYSEILFDTQFSSRIFQNYHSRLARFPAQLIIIISTVIVLITVAIISVWLSELSAVATV